MNLPLNQNAVLQLEDWLSSLEGNYVPKDAALLKMIVSNAIKNRYIKEDEVYLLLDLLPKIIPRSIEGDNHVVEDDPVDVIPHVPNRNFKKKTERLHQAILNLLFQQNAIRQSQSGREPLSDRAILIPTKKRNQSKNR